VSAKRFIGTVVSAKMIGTVVVAVDQSQRHSIYKKLVRNTSRIKAHTSESLKNGDVVEIAETKPYARHVSFIVVRKLKGE